MKTWWILWCVVVALEPAVSKAIADPLPVAVVQCVRETGNDLYARVALNGQKNPHWWLVDTGSPFALIGSQEARNLQALPVAHTSARGNESRKVFTAADVAVGGYHFGPFPFLQAPLGFGSLRAQRTTQYSGSFEKGGILGLNFLTRHGALLNFRTQQIFLAERGPTLSMSRTGYEKMGFTYIPIRITSQGRIEVVGSVGPKTYSFMIDTGAPNTLLLPYVRTAAGAAAWTAAQRENFVLMNYESSHVSFGPLRGFRLGSHDVSDETVGFADFPGRSWANGYSHPFGGLLGENLLWAHQAILDIGGRALYLKPDPRTRH